MQDQLIKATAAGGRIRAVAIRTTNLAEEARTRHELSPTAAAALGKTMTGSLMLASVLRKTGRINVRVTGKGPIGGIFVDAGTDGTVRGYVGNPVLDLPQRPDGQLDVGGAIGREGFLSVTYDLGTRPYAGTVELVSGELGEDFTYYLGKSEQIPSAMSLGIYVDRGVVKSAGGFLVQLMPDAGDEIAERLESTVLNVPFFTELERKGTPLPEILKQVLEGFNVEILEENLPVRFSCHCNQQRVIDAIRVLGPDEIREMIASEGKAEARCHFCNTQYVVGRDELERLIVA